MNQQDKIPSAKIIECLQLYVKCSADALMHFNGAKPSLYQKTFLDLIRKFRFNAEALIPIVELFAKDSRHKLALSLILRCCMSDFLTLCYLHSFLDKEATEQISFENECKILYSEHLKFRKEILDVHEVNGYFKNNSDDLKNARSSLYSQNPEYFNFQNNEYTFKKTGDFRNTSKDNFFEVLKNKNTNTPLISEKYKYLHLTKNSSYSQYWIAYATFKYYSQFQHFNPMSDKMIMIVTELDLTYLRFALDHIFVGTEMALSAIDRSTVEIIQRLAPIRNILAETLSNED